MTDLDPVLLRELQADPTDPEAIWDELVRRGWSDGLPVISPTADRVTRMLDGREPDESIGVFGASMGVEGRSATVAKVAANAVMAGCDPAYFPVVLTAMSLIAGAGGGSAFLNSPAAPMLVLNGDVRHELGVNCGQEMLSLTTRANATIGRAVRLSLMNIVGARVPDLFDVQHGQPGRAGMVFGEYEEESPWEPRSVSVGLRAGPERAVTLYGAMGTMPINYHQVPQSAQELLLILTRCLDYVRGNRIGPSADTGGGVVVLSPKHAQAFAREGWDKQRLEQELTSAVNDHYDIELEAHRIKLELINRGHDPDEPMITLSVPEDPVTVLVAGGLGGWHSLYVPSISWVVPTTSAI